MNKRRSLWTQLQMVLLPGWGGRHHSVQEVRRARDVLRVGAVFAATILVPALLLSWLSLTSIRSEELFVDAEYRTQADDMTAEIDVDVQTIFERFEFATRSRIERSESPLARLADLSPYLRGAYRFDANGNLAAPFDASTPPNLPEPTAGFEERMLQAHALERDEQYRKAAAEYAAAASVTSVPAYRAEALFGEARVLGAAGATRLEEERLAQLYADYATVRGRQGFRFGDLTQLILAQRQFESGASEAGTAAMQQLVIRLLTQQWTIGKPGEATIARHALGQLAGTADPDWIARRRTELNERVAQLTWTENIKDELELISSARPNGNEVALIGANMDSDAVWAVLSAPNGRYAFAFSQERMARDLYATIDRINDRQDLLTVQLLTIREPLPDGQVTVSPLRPPLSTLRLAIAPRDPAELAQLKDRRRRTRLAIVFVSVFLVLVGVFFSARTIGQEIESARMKADFAANVSHELRSPITQIRLKGEALQLGLVDEGDDTRQHYDAIVREAERLSRLVDNVLDFAAIERGAKRYQLRIEDLLSVVWTTVEANRHAVETQGLELELDLPDDTPPVWMDREAIGQVLVNLLSNAAKYGQKGGWVGVRVRTEPQGVTLSVSDRGQGIKADDLPYIFEHFYRSTSASVRRQKGTGIGLAIVRYIVEAHGGTITVDSVHGKGTTFTVTFPNEPPPGAGAAT